MFNLAYFVESVIERRRFAIVSLVSAICLLFIALLAPAVQAQRSTIEGHIHSSSADQVPLSVNDNPDVVTNALSEMADDTGRLANRSEITMLGGALSTATAVTHAEYGVADGVQFALVSSYHGALDGAMFMVHTTKDGFESTGRGIGDTARLVYRVRDVGSVIHPQSHTPEPVITKLEEQQASIIQSGTQAVVIASAVSDGTGGACDDGNGNGYYPANWCNAPMDTIATIPYSSDPINRECTSYAYWYFTSVEGHTGFRAWGNAKYWATTSNYPTHSAPAIGAIAVETAGEYGHVAIVQALPGQQYAGKTVPAGYVLVSEMNYDWHGHFRYSYSPLSKFSAYIY